MLSRYCWLGKGDVCGVQTRCFMRLGHENASYGVLLHLCLGIQIPYVDTKWSSQRKKISDLLFFYEYLFCVQKQNIKRRQALLGPNVCLCIGPLPCSMAGLTCYLARAGGGTSSAGVHTVPSLVPLLPQNAMCLSYIHADNGFTDYFI